MQVWSLGWEDSLEEGMAWQPTPVFLSGESYEQSIGLHRVRHDWSDLACMHTESLEFTVYQISVNCIESNSRDPQRFPWMHSRVLLNACIWGNCLMLGKELYEKIRGNSVSHRSSCGTCSHQPDWENPCNSLGFG